MSSIKFAFRTLFKTPFVTVIAIVSLALGIGANAAIFSCFNQMLLQSLTVPHPEQLVNLSAPGPKPGSQSCNQAGDCDAVFSYAMFRDLQKVQTVFTGIAAHRLFGANQDSDRKRKRKNEKSQRELTVPVAVHRADNPWGQLRTGKLHRQQHGG